MSVRLLLEMSFDHPGSVFPVGHDPAAQQTESQTVSTLRQQSFCHQMLLPEEASAVREQQRHAMRV